MTCLLVVASAGYGKTTALRRRLPGAVWLPGSRIEELVAGGLKELACTDDPPQWIVVDDVPRLAPDAAEALLETACGLPAPVGVALASRWPLAAPLWRWRGQGVLSELRPADLALSVDDVADLLAGEYGLSEPALPERVHEATAGWPALVHLLAEAVASGGGWGVEPGTALFGYLADEVLGALPAEVGRLVRDTAEFAPITAGLGEAFGHPNTAEALVLLARTGLLTPGRRLVPLLADAAQVRARRPAGRALTAARFYERHGPPLAAAQAYRRAGDTDRCRRVLRTQGDDILGTGAARAVVELIGSLPGGPGDLTLLFGDALRTAGNVADAQRAYAAVADGEVWPAGVAWRMGLVHYLRGEPKAALDAFARAEPGEGPDAALLLSWTATAHLMLGAEPVAIELARQACRTADAADDARAQATAHITLALCLHLTGDPAGSDQHYSEALRLAERIGDLLLVTRIHTNRLAGDATFADSLATARLAVKSAEAAGHANLLSIALCNEAQALARLGRSDEAVTVYERVVRMSQRMGSRRVAAALVGLGDVHAGRGWHQQARAAYEEAIRTTRDGGDNQALILALAGLARVLAPEDPVAATGYADEAVRLAAGNSRLHALLARGWVAARTGDRPRATTLAADVVAIARNQRERVRLAEALELAAAAETDPARARSALAEAYGIWRETGATVDSDRVLAALGRLPGASTDDRLSGLLAAERLAALDVRPGRPVPGDPAGRPVAIRAFGRFEVIVDDRPVPASAWQSRKARDLLRILVARRGRPIPRAELAELLWPDDDVGRTGHRLSVLLSIVRTALDPNRNAPADQFVIADAASVALDVGRLRVDVEDFLADVRHALRLHERGADTQARALLGAAVTAYTGDAFEDEPYADWTGPLREEARAEYLRAVRVLAALSRAAGDTEQAVCHLLQILHQDPYDETAHRTMVDTLAADGRHGEARRAFDRYAEAMRAIGVRPPPESLLRSGATVTGHRSSN